MTQTPYPPFGDLNMIPEEMQRLVVSTFGVELEGTITSVLGSETPLERGYLSDMDGVLTKSPYQYAIPLLDKRIIQPLARANRQVAKSGHPLHRLAVVSARDVEAQLKVPGMPQGIYHFGGLGTRFYNPDSRSITYTGDPQAQALCNEVRRLLVQRLITGGRKKFIRVYWDDRVDGINLLLEELSEALQHEVVTICQQISAELGLGTNGSPISLEYRLGVKEPNCDFLSSRMEAVGKGTAVTDFLAVFPNVGFLVMQEDTERWLHTFVEGAQQAMKQDTLKGHCAILIAPLPDGEFKIKQTGPTSWWITLTRQNVLPRFEEQYVTLLERGGGLA